MPAADSTDRAGATADPGIFISYRREDSGHLAGRLADHLVGAFGERSVFVDVESIDFGLDFFEVIDLALAKCKVLLVLIGRAWLGSADGSGEPRINSPEDPVRVEIEAGLRLGVRIIPVLVDDLAMPRREDLPEQIAALARLNAARVRHETFRDDARRLVTVIRKVLAD